MEFLNEKETAQLYKCSVFKLRNDRSAGRGMPYYKSGASVKYCKQEVIDFITKQHIVPVNNYKHG